jgi:anti-sigma B factor antagonist
MSDISTGQQANLFSIKADLVDGSAVITLAGEIDLAAAPAVCDTVAVVAAADHGVVIDASEVTFLDCAGLGALLSTAESCGAEVVLRSPSRPVLWLCELAGLVPPDSATCESCSHLRLA